MTYTITTEYLEHDGGTKFYEMVLIEEKGGPALLVKRFGKISDKIGGGGQAQFTRGSQRVCREEMQSVTNAKMKGKAGLGKYDRANRPTYALHNYQGRDVDGAQLHKLAENHYQAKHVGEIYRYFDIDFAGAVDLPDAELENDVATDVVTPPPRDASWGSW